MFRRHCDGIRPGGLAKLCRTFPPRLAVSEQQPERLAVVVIPRLSLVDELCADNMDACL